MEDNLQSSLLWLSQSTVPCELFLVFQVALLATGPCSTVTRIFHPPISLVIQDFPILHFFVALHVRSVLAPKPRWLSLCLLELVKGELRLSQLSGVTVWAHHLFLIFLLLTKPYKLIGWIEVPATLL